MRTGAAAIVLAALLACSGCGSGAAPHGMPTVPVKGKITYKGQPLSRGSIRFAPEDDGREAHGDIQPDGTFVMSTFKEGDGAIAGIHRVAVKGTGKGGKEAVPQKYRSPTSSKVEVEVTEGEAEYTIDLK